MEKINIEVSVNAPIKKVWDYWTGVEHIAGWAFASDDWGAEGITNDLRNGGTFSSRMFAKDGSFEFMFSGTYNEVVAPTSLDYILDDGRWVSVQFTETPTGVHVTQSFEPESQNPIDIQRDGWQAFLNNFKKYVESA
jgi:uncharacterized protein YndB with AHSA1/START domain